MGNVQLGKKFCLTNLTVNAIWNMVYHIKLIYWTLTNILEVNWFTLYIIAGLPIGIIIFIYSLDRIYEDITNGEKVLFRRLDFKTKLTQSNFCTCIVFYLSFNTAMGFLMIIGLFEGNVNINSTSLYIMLNGLISYILMKHIIFCFKASIKN